MSNMKRVLSGTATRPEARLAERKFELVWELSAAVVLGVLAAPVRGLN